ncbi:MAG: glycoside hydrolase [Gammaproteobacteria bacterium]|nr:glycoside hydrolase [Gammaproteobacteria bacterium]NIR98122.1 glycoside hydrolase [Gammaproteobacteria bacterium]NIT63814.1 glycoside hydrolase [Gammaproteobacteria bacterium]NIV20764.1 glycoside hydrolase [Gammaproteobacteria bacterium]NIX10013.1 glycoside hydrolase [Gammaproteobacteria bacterium]
MSDSRPHLRVVLCWHMHQPQYLDPVSDRYELPWTYLHAIKDYVDMAAHLERVPGARAVVNFTPTLLEQLDHYSDALREHLRGGAPLPDPLLGALAAPEMPREPEARAELARACLRANEQRMINRFPAFRRLADMAGWVEQHPALAEYVNERFLADLLVWYHLAWLGETVHRDNDAVRGMIQRGAGFDYEDRRRLLELIAELLSGVVPRYRRLAEQGKIELSVTPYAHPIMPLLLELGSARQAIPDLALPRHRSYPGGEARVRRHIEQALVVFDRHFGFRPTGVWPAEGAVSKAGLGLLDEYGFRWAATGGQVLRNTLERGRTGGGETQRCLHRPYRLQGQRLMCFFRDDGLSDLIGFSFSDWHADDAVGNLIHHLENIALSCRGHDDAVTAIVLDGENAWEHYPENGYHFLDALYDRLAAHPQLELTTFEQCVERCSRPVELSGLVAGSWVYGTLTTWIGHPDKNRAWDMLVEAKRVYDEVMTSGELDAAEARRAEHQLAVCEGSDWFWWFGDENPASSVRDFDRLYRTQLTRLYELLGRPAPEYLSRMFTHGGGAPARGGVMRPGVHP